MSVECIESAEVAVIEEIPGATPQQVVDRDSVDITWKGAGKDAKRAVLKVVVLSSGCVVSAAETVASATRRAQSAAVAALSS